jgi:predicted RNA-binding Zn-ribbon protein involved in translation (DUF1610 family)
MGELFNTIRNLKRDQHHLRICPKCGSAKIREVSSLGGWILPSRYVCDDCGYDGYLLLELEKE